ncbi:MAG TPA: hypothetical protein VK403_07970 [Allosphingosinicella sp.]|nr:hypothetical protein [Allosphingosinicella sp.]
MFGLLECGNDRIGVAGETKMRERGPKFRFVIPANAGIQRVAVNGPLACMDSRFRRNDEGGGSGKI